jgi:hypothetical protein
VSNCHTAEPPGWLIKRTDGKTAYGINAIALFYGLDADSIDPCAQPLAQLSDEQKEIGRRRTEEARAATGTDEAVDILRYWARRDLKVDVLDTGEWVILMPLMNPN